MGDYDARRDVANIDKEAKLGVADTQKDATIGKAEIDKDSSTGDSSNLKVGAEATIGADAESSKQLLPLMHLSMVLTRLLMWHKSTPKARLITPVLLEMKPVRLRTTRLA